jgi:hypothetical protein
VNRSICIAALAALLALPVAAQAQDEEAAAPDTYESRDDGSTLHRATQAVCPETLGSLQLVQVLSFDSETEHMGIGCQYANQFGWTGALSFLRADVTALVGPGDSAQRWNRSLYSILGSYPNALPAQRDGLGGDEGSGMRGALFSTSAGGVPVRVGLWQVDVGDWQLRAQATFAANADGWSIAEATRGALIEAQSAAGS